MELKIIHTADIHFDTPHKNLGDSSKANIRREDMYASFKKIIGLSKNADMLIISGDLFDGNNVSKTTLEFLKEEFSKIPEVRVFICAGNHDYRGDESVYNTFDFGENVYVFDTDAEKIETDVADIYGISFKTANDNRKLLEKISVSNPDKINILVMHGNLSGTDYNPVSLTDISNSGMDYIALGHIHAYSGVLSSGRTFYAYPGCPEGRGFDELGEKGVIALSLSKGNADATFVPVCERMYLDLKVDITDALGYDEILERINEVYQGEKHIYRIRLCGEAPFFVDTEVVKSKITGFMVEVQDETTTKIDLEKLKDEFTLKGLFAKYALEDKVNLSEEEFENALKAGLSLIEKEERNENR